MAQDYNAAAAYRLLVKANGLVFGALGEAIAQPESPAGPALLPVARAHLQSRTRLFPDMPGNQQQLEAAHQQALNLLAGLENVVQYLQHRRYGPS